MLDNFLLPMGFYTALALIPFLLLYLIRPKPRHERIPSLLFVLRDLGRSNTRNLFRNVLRDLLLILQLLFLLALILAAAQPYVYVPRTYLVEQTILLVDVSASMQAGDFDRVRQLAIENLGKRNTIVLISSNPDTLVEDASLSEAEAALDGLAPTASPTDIAGALQLASGLATAGSRVVVISDFLPSAGDPDYEHLADAIEARGAIVDYLPVTASVENRGIIDLIVGPAESSVWIKNYAVRPAEITLTIAGSPQQLLLARSETKRVDFETPSGVAEVSITPDAFPIDDRVYLSTPEQNLVRILIITNDQASAQQSNFLLGLGVISRNFPTQFEIEYAEPPTIPDLDHDVFIIWNANLDFVLPGYVTTLRERVSEGAALFFFTQPALFSIDWQGLIPVDALESQGSRSEVLPEAISPITRDIEFGQVASYDRVTARDGTTTIARSEQDPVIVLGRNGRGSTLYYGLAEAQASFSKSPTYPIFWRRLFDLVTNRPSLTNLNMRTGTVLVLPKRIRVETPTQSLVTSILPLNHVGLYNLPDRTIAVNLISEGESRLAAPTINRTSATTGEEAEEQVPKPITNYLLWLAILLLFIELLYVKYRGDF